MPFMDLPETLVPDSQPELSIEDLDAQLHRAQDQRIPPPHLHQHLPSFPLTLRAVQTLLAHRNALASHILSDPSVLSLPDRAAVSAAPDPEAVARLRALHPPRRAAAETAAHRLALGATLFRAPRDGPWAPAAPADDVGADAHGAAVAENPEWSGQTGDAAATRRETLGVRIESFDRRARRFRAPWYLFLVPTRRRAAVGEDDEGQEGDVLGWRVHRSVIPGEGDVSEAVAALAEQWLYDRGGENGGEEGDTHTSGGTPGVEGEGEGELTWGPKVGNRLAAFVREVRRVLMDYDRRTEEKEERRESREMAS